MAFSIPADDEAPGPRAELRDPTTSVHFLLAGNAHVTFQSRKTGTRFTYRVEANRKSVVEETPGAIYAGSGGPSHFVSVLVGPDNEHSYQYLGCIYRNVAYSHGRKSKIDRNAPGAIAFAWVWKRLSAGEMHPELAVYHEGRCSVCSRRLTTPESIETGIGPTCRERLGL